MKQPLCPWGLVRPVNARRRVYVRVQRLRTVRPLVSWSAGRCGQEPLSCRFGRFAAPQGGL
eukprot:6551027-Pyramimonas_sp.AAC.1